MAKTKIKKSDAVREVMKQHPHMKVMEIVRHLAEKGITVLPNHVYSIKAKKPKRKKHAATAAMSPSSNGVPSPIQTLIKVKSLARELGGLRTLKQFVDELVA